MGSPTHYFGQRPVFAAALTMCLLGAQDAVAQKGEPCRFEARDNGIVAAIVDARSVRLADGREIKLAGIDLAPAASRAALEDLVLGKDIALAAPSEEPDRYGRITAFAFVNGSETPVQYKLLSLGHARVPAAVEDHACAAALLREERKARDARIGLWADPRYAVRAAGDGQAIRLLRGRFSVAEGRVVSVRDGGHTIYINFGRRWSEALTVTILKRHEPAFAAAGLGPKSLEGRTIRVRGYVDVRNGPVIEATRPGQIEIAAR
jgi:endonuclease YncB( thermonuclease family)